MASESGDVAHWSQMGSRIASIYKEEKFTDFALMAGGLTLKCHKVVLSAASDYLDAMFNSGMVEAIESEVELKDMSADTLKHVVNYIYSGDIRLDTVTVEDIIKAAELLQLSGLKDRCISYMVDALDTNNCIGFHTFARTYQLPAVEEAAWSIMLDCFSDVIQGEEFKQLSLGDLRNYIGDDRLVVTAEDEVLGAVVMWLKEEEEKREGKMVELLSHVRMAYCSLAAMIKQMTEPYTSNTECREIFTNALKHHDSHCSRIHIALKPRNSYFKGIIVVGGHSVHGEINLSCSIFNMSQERWTCFTCIPSSARTYSVCQVDDGFVLSGVGADHTECWQYAYESNKWKQLPDMKAARSGHSSIMLGEYVYVVGGIQATSVMLSSVERLNLTQNEWTPVQSLPEPCRYLQLVTYDNAIYKFGGQVKSTESEIELCFRNYKLDNTSRCWKRLKGIPEECFHCDAVVFNDHIFLVGGCSQRCMQYTPREDIWITLSRPLLRHACGSAVVWKGSILLGGGIAGGDNSSITNVIEVYNPALDRWSISEFRLQHALCYHFMFII